MWFDRLTTMWFDRLTMMWFDRLTTMWFDRLTMILSRIDASPHADRRGLRIGDMAVGFDRRRGLPPDH